MKIGYRPPPSVPHFCGVLAVLAAASLPGHVDILSVWLTSTTLVLCGLYMSRMAPRPYKARLSSSHQARTSYSPHFLRTSSSYVMSLEGIEHLTPQDLDHVHSGLRRIMYRTHPLRDGDWMDEGNVARANQGAEQSHGNSPPRLDPMHNPPTSHDREREDESSASLASNRSDSRLAFTIYGPSRKSPLHTSSYHEQVELRARWANGCVLLTLGATVPRRRASSMIEQPTMPVPQAIGSPTSSSRTGSVRGSGLLLADGREVEGLEATSPRLRAPVLRVSSRKLPTVPSRPESTVVVEENKNSVHSLLASLEEKVEEWRGRAKKEEGGAGANEPKRRAESDLFPLRTSSHLVQEEAKQGTVNQSRSVRRLPQTEVDNDKNKAIAGDAPRAATSPGESNSKRFSFDSADLLASLPPHLRQQITGYSIPAPLYHDVECSAMCHPVSVCADGEQPMFLTLHLVIHRLDDTCALIVKDADRLKPLVWCSMQHQPVLPLEISAPRLSHLDPKSLSPPSSSSSFPQSPCSSTLNCIAWDLVLPGLTAPSALEIAVGVLGQNNNDDENNDAHVEQLLPNVAQVILVTRSELADEIVSHPTVVGDLAALVEFALQDGQNAAPSSTIRASVPRETRRGEEDALLLSSAEVAKFDFFSDVAKGMAHFAQEQELHYLDVFVRDIILQRMDEARSALCRDKKPVAAMPRNPLEEDQVVASKSKAYQPSSTAQSIMSPWTLRYVDSQLEDRYLTARLHRTMCRSLAAATAATLIGILTFVLTLPFAMFSPRSEGGMRPLDRYDMSAFLLPVLCCIIVRHFAPWRASNQRTQRLVTVSHYVISGVVSRLLLDIGTIARVPSACRHTGGATTTVCLLVYLATELGLFRIVYDAPFFMSIPVALVGYAALVASSMSCSSMHWVSLCILVSQGGVRSASLALAYLLEWRDRHHFASKAL